jgi:hypothetical protein
MTALGLDRSPLPPPRIHPPHLILYQFFLNPHMLKHIVPYVMMHLVILRFHILLILATNVVILTQAARHPCPCSHSLLGTAVAFLS